MNKKISVKNSKNKNKKDVIGLLFNDYYPAVLMVLACVSFVFLALTNVYRIVNIYDEGAMAYGSLMVLDGGVPYRDFFTVYAPAQYYLTALVYKIFGVSLGAMRLWDVLLRVGLVMALFVVGRRVSGVLPALLTWLTALLWLGSLQWYGYPAIPALLFCIISLEFLRMCFLEQKISRLFIAGILCGVTFLFRIDFGIYTLISALLAVAVTGGFKLMKNPPALPELKFYLYGLLSAVFIPSVYFLIAAGPKEVLYNLIIYPFFIQPEYRHLPFPWILKGSFAENFPYYYPFIIYGITAFHIYAVIESKNKGKVQKIQVLTLLPFLLAGLFYFLQLNNRPDYAHLEPFLFTAVLLQAFVYQRAWNMEGIYKYGVLAVLLAANVMVLITPVKDVLAELKRGAPQKSAITRTGRAVLNGDMAKAIQFIQSKTSKDDYIFCGNTSHDKITGNDVMTYFLSERKSATKYFCFEPGSANTPEVQRRIVSDLTEKNVKYIILFSGYEGAGEPNKSSESSGCFELDDFIKGNFKKIWESEPFSVLEKNPQ